MENLNFVIAKNLTELRKKNRLTQLELAEKLNYSDKAVSKWERGESIPDLLVIKQIADLFGVTVDALLREPDVDKVKPSRNINKKRVIISACSAGLVWLVAVVVYSFMNIIYPPFIEKAWLAFIIAIPINFIVLLSLTSVWGKNLLNALFTSLLVWTLILAIYLSLYNLLTAQSTTLWMIFLIGIPLQVLIVFWFWGKKVK